MQPEDMAFAIFPAIGLEPFETAARVMKNMRRRMHRYRRQRLERRRLPLAVAVGKACDRKMIAKLCTKNTHLGSAVYGNSGGRYCAIICRPFAIVECHNRPKYRCAAELIVQHCRGGVNWNYLYKEAERNV